MARRADVLRFAVGASWGAGIAIAPNRALTSLHVVGAVVEGQLALHADTIEIAAELSDSDGETETTNYPTCQCTIDDVVDFNGELDWIVVDLDASAFAGMVIPPLGAVLASDAEGACTSYGFPDEGSDLGVAVDGVVLSIAAPVQLAATTASALQLRMRDAAAPDGGPAPGFFGAPIMVGRHVIGLVCAAATSADEAAAGELYALPLTQIAERLKLKLDPRGELKPAAAPPPSPEPPAGKARAPKVAGPLARLRSRFRGVQPQLVALGKLTALHHALQQLDLPYQALSRERRRLAVSPPAWDELREPLETLGQLLAQAIALVDADPGDEVAALRRRLAGATHSLQAAIEGGDDPEALDAALLEVRRVLAIDLPVANHRARGALRELGLGDVVPPLRAALDALPRDDTSDPRLDELPPLVTSLETLHGRLDGLIRNHDAWLGLDRELGFFADTGRPALDDAQRAWPVLRASLDAAAAGAAERWSDAIAAARDQLDGDIARGARASAQLTSLRALWRACHLQFVDIHHQVARTCEELARVSATLGGVLDAVKQIDG